MRHGSTEASIGTNVQSPIHCSKGILSGTVFSTQMCSLPDDTDDDDDSMLIIVHFQSLYCGLCLICGLTPARHQRPTHLGGNLAAPELVRAGGAGAGYIWILGTESNSLSSSRSLRQPSIWYFLPSPQSSAGRREREERGNCRPGLQDTRRLMGLSPPPPNLGWLRTLVSSLRSCVSASAFSFCLFASFSVWIITLSQCSGCSEKISYDDIELSQILINLLRIVCLISHGIIWLCWLDPGQAHCHWGPGLSALSWSPDPLESVLFWDRGEVFSPVRLGSGGIRPSFIRFFCFILRFWNQIFTWKITKVSKNILDQFYAHLFLSHSERRVLGNIYLSFIQLKRRCNLYPSRPRQIFIKVKFLLEFC